MWHDFSFNLKKNKYQLLYSFNCSDGQSPDASLLHLNGLLYGTTGGGGAYGYGTVFSFDPRTSIETVVHSFNNDGTDGNEPFAPVIAINGIMYGTTYNGGAYGDGIVFSVDPSTGVEKVLHSFWYGNDGAQPVGGLVDVKGTLYGTTYLGGTYNKGIVYSLVPATGALVVLHSFQNNGADGYYPESSLVKINGRLYGTTMYGGRFTGCSYSFSGCGTVFSIEPKTGHEHVLHSFQSGLDGNLPFAGLLAVNGTLYGTTTYGGGGAGQGAVFAVAP